jgi:hypothetical protein
MKNSRWNAILVTHSHWDREWYQPVETCRFRLVELIDRLLDILKQDPAYHSFWLDGQTIPLDDYAAVRPERMEELSGWLRQNKIRVGPWYVLADEHLVSGEACLRNLLLGLSISKGHGQRQAIGYMPDTFGHIDQLPQILRGFEIDNAFFWRGYDKESLDSADTEWIGRDGTAVKAVCLVGGYSNARGLTRDIDATSDRIDLQMPALKRFSGSGTLLLMNGIDHALPLDHLAEMIPGLEARFPGLSVRHGSPQDYLQAVAGSHRKSRPLTGELFHVPALDGCLSTRPLQKRLNRLLENRLAHYAEPLALMAADRLGGLPKGLLDRAWRLLLQCHPHDTICGCHADTVARDMENRLDRGLQLADELENRALHALLGARNGYGKPGLPCTIAVYNPLPWRRRETITLDLPLPPGAAAGDLQVTGADGVPLPGRILETRPGVHTIFHDYTIPTRLSGRFATIQFDAADLPPMATALFTVSAKASGTVSIMEDTGRERAEGKTAHVADRPLDVLENDRLRATVHPDGSLDLLDKATGLSLQGLNSLRLQPDRGDLYHFAPALRDEVCRIRAGSLVRLADSPFSQTIRVLAPLAFREADLALTIDLTLAAGSDRLEIAVSFSNTARDFRLQAAFPVPSDGTALAHTPFSLTPRKPVPPRETVRMESDKRFRVNAVSQPLQYMAQFNLKKGQALAVLSRGLCEYTWEQPGLPCLTLMRASGKICDSLSGFSAEGGQSSGPQVFEYALAVPRDRSGAEALRSAYEFNLPSKVLPVFAAPSEDPSPGIEFLNPRWMPAALKPAESGTAHVLRFWNASEKRESGLIRLPPRYRKAALARLDETPLGPVKVTRNQLRLTVNPFEIVTVLLA